MSRFSNLEFEDESNSALNEAPVRNGEYYLCAARRAFENGEFEPALRHFSKVLEFDPNNAEAWTAQVRMLVELGELKEAALWANKALERFPQHPDLLAAKAVALARSGNFEEALACSDVAIELRGETPYVWLARADVLLARKEARSAYCFEKAMLLAPGDWVVSWLASRIHFYYKKFGLALKMAQRALELNSGHFLLWLHLGECQVALGFVSQAGKSFTQARELNPGCDAAASNLATVGNAGLGTLLLGLWRRLF